MVSCSVHRRIPVLRPPSLHLRPRLIFGYRLICGETRGSQSPHSAYCHMGRSPWIRFLSRLGGRLDAFTIRALGRALAAGDCSDSETITPITATIVCNALQFTPPFNLSWTVEFGLG